MIKYDGYYRLTDYTDDVIVKDIEIYENTVFFEELIGVIKILGKKDISNKQYFKIQDRFKTVLNSKFYFSYPSEGTSFEKLENKQIIALKVLYGVSDEV